MAMAMMKGTRLEFVVVPLEGKVTRIKHIMKPAVAGKNADGTKRYMHTMEQQAVEEDAGFMVYFPRGHALRLNKAQLKHYGLERDPNIINLEGLQDRSTPLGQLFMKQDKDGRSLAYAQLEKQVIQLVEGSAIGGAIQLTRNVAVQEAA